MRPKLPGLSGLGAAALVMAFGCQGSGSFAALQEKLTQIQDKQDAILARLDTLESKIGQGGAAAPGQKPPQGPKPGQPDPKATYRVDVGQGWQKGPADAKVTIIEWSDFQ